MLESRSYQTEQLDQLDLSGQALTRTLHGLSVINRYLGNQRSTVNAFDKWLNAQPNRIAELSVVDLGCGGGDSLRAIAHWMRTRAIKGRLTGIDGNQNTLDLAQKQSSQFPEITYQQADILAPSHTVPTCDILYSSHFTYHFTDAQLVNFLREARANVRHAFLFSELQRHWLPYTLFRTGGAVLPFHRMVKQDGLTAISRSLTAAEWREAFTQAGYSNVAIRKTWAFRYQITAPTQPTDVE